MRLQQAHVVVIGGGFAGQLVQLSIPSARLLDWRKTPPTHHLETRIGPQYLWEPITGVPSKSFPVTTLVDGEKPTSASILAYKKKIGKEEDGGNWGLQFQHETTGWSSELPVPRVEYNRHVRSVNLYGHSLWMADGVEIHYDVLINTIPLDFFLKLCLIPPIVHYPWKHDPIYMLSVPRPGPLNGDGMKLNYISDPVLSWYRETDSGPNRFYESLTPAPGHKSIMPGKIHPHQESEDVLRALKIFDTFCFGRYATWRPDELAHETWKHIEEWKGTV